MPPAFQATQVAFSRQPPDGYIPLKPLDSRLQKSAPGGRMRKKLYSTGLPDASTPSTYLFAGWQRA